MPTVLAEPSASRAVLIGVHTYRWLDDLPAVQRNLVRLKEILTDPEIWGLPPSHCEIVDQPASSPAVMDAVMKATSSAQDTIVIYYAGHGLTSPHKFDELHLALPDTSKDRLYAGLQFDWIRHTLLDAKALRKIVILDCCYSGRALSGAMADTGHLADQATVEGTVILAAAAETARALAPQSEEFTAFTGELITVIEEGIHDGPQLLSIDVLYPHLLKALRAKGRPEPQQRNRNTGGSVAIARNRAFVAAPEGSVSQQDPFELGVHRAVNSNPKASLGEKQELPGYVTRQHDHDLDEFLTNQHGNTMAILVGNSSTGKTRAGYEAALRHFSDWPLLRIEGVEHLIGCAVKGRLIQPSVIWLDEAHFFFTSEDGETAWKILERIVLGNVGGPVAILGTMWPEFGQALMTAPGHGTEDPLDRFRKFSGTTVGYFTVPDTLSVSASDVSDDPLLLSAIQAAGATGKVIQELSGAPFIIERYLHPAGTEGRFERAIVTAAIDARRLGYLSPFPDALLAEAAVAYLDKSDLSLASHDWFEAGLRSAAISAFGMGALRRYSGGVGAVHANEYILNEYLENYGRSLRATAIVPSAVWSALTSHTVDPDDCIRIAIEAGKRGLYQYAIPLATRAADTGDRSAWRELTYLLERSQAVSEAEAWWHRAVDSGDTTAIARLADLLQRTGRISEAEPWWHRAVDSGDTTAIARLADLLERTGRISEAEPWWHRAVDSGDTTAIQRLADLLQRTGREPEAEKWWRRAAEISDIRVMLRAAERLYSADRAREAETLWSRAAEAGNTYAMMRLADYLERNGRVSESGLWLRRAADAGHLPARVKLAQQRERVGRAGGERPWRQRVAASAPIARGAKKLFIGNLPYDATDEDLCEFFAQYGEVLSSAMVFDRATGRAKGFGFVEMPADAARIAISRGDGANFGNRVLTVSEARPEAETR